MEIRRAKSNDAAAWAALAESTFRDTFGVDNTPENMDTHCASTYGESIQRREIEDPEVEIWLCFEGEQPIAYFQLRWSEAPSCIEAKRPVEIQRFYVDRPWHGKGVAGEMMQAVLRRAQKGGADQVWLGVWEHNPRAITFYEKFGFEKVGDQVFTLGEDPQRDLILTRASAHLET